MSAPQPQSLPQLSASQHARALVIIERCTHSPTAYTQFRGKRLVDLHRIISVPLGRSVRLLFVDGPTGLSFVEGQTHEQYNRTVSPKCRSSWARRVIARVSMAPA